MPSQIKQSEKKTESYLVEQVNKRGGMCIKLLPFLLAGLPDRLVLLKKFMCFVETKSEGQKPRKIQLCMHNKIRALGFDVYVIDKKEQVDNLMKEYECR